MSLVKIELVNVSHPEDVYQQIEGQLELDEPIAQNLDALHDVLTTDVAGPVEIIWHDHGFSRVALGEWYASLMEMLQAVTDARPDITLSLQ